MTINRKLFSDSGFDLHYCLDLISIPEEANNLLAFSCSPQMQNMETFEDNLNVAYFFMNSLWHTSTWNSWGCLYIKTN